MRHRIRIPWVLLLLAACGPAAPESSLGPAPPGDDAPAVASPGDEADPPRSPQVISREGSFVPGSRCFPQTQRCIEGRIREFWEVNGGSELFGNPVSPELELVSATDGRVYRAQWFERARVELHPELAGTPYEVSLGLLGVEAYRSRHGGPAPFRPEAKNPSCDWVEAGPGGTGINVCGAFRDFARALATKHGQRFGSGPEARTFLLGMPLTPPVRERVQVGGQALVRTVQWFERARLESVGQPPAQVVLAPLGSELFNQAPRVPDGLPDYLMGLDAPRIEVKDFAANAPELDPQEACISAAGRRRLLRFTTVVKNVGDADLHLGSPENDPRFLYSTAHQHYHLKDFARYRLLDSSAAVVATGHKQAFAIYDVYPTGGRYTDEDQGLGVGYADVYREVPCQWVDITGVPAGGYTLEVTVNPGGMALEESQLDNNVAWMDVTIDSAGRLVDYRTR